MSKKGPLGVAEKFYISEHYGETPIDDLCKTLDRAKSSVEAYIGVCERRRVKQPTLHNETGIISSNGSTVMTTGGSQTGDDFNKRGFKPRPASTTTAKQKR